MGGKNTGQRICRVFHRVNLQCCPHFRRIVLIKPIKYFDMRELFKSQQTGQKGRLDFDPDRVILFVDCSNGLDLKLFRHGGRSFARANNAEGVFDSIQIIFRIGCKGF